ncbi:hypothetical protein Pelo_15299 [Pelomyxa schiedti]|nr:hypothetical protein Pelo_15299 [Pelomyxa schiedti]
MCIITNYLTSNFSSIYISHMPEYESIKRDKEDLQLLYNSFIFLFNQGLANTSLVSLCTEAIAKQIGSSLVPSKMSLYDVPSDLLEKLYNELKLLGKLDSKTKTLFPCTLTASEE